MEGRTGVFGCDMLRWWRGPDVSRTRKDLPIGDFLGATGLSRAVVWQLLSLTSIENTFFSTFAGLTDTLLSATFPLFFRPIVDIKLESSIKRLQLHEKMSRFYGLRVDFIRLARTQAHSHTHAQRRVYGKHSHFDHKNRYRLAEPRLGECQRT